MKIKKDLAPRLRGDSLPAHQLDQRQLNRAFSAWLHGDLNSWGAAPGLILRQRRWRFERLQISLNRSKMKFHDSTCPPLSANSQMSPRTGWLPELRQSGVRVKPSAGIFKTRCRNYLPRSTQYLRSGPLTLVAQAPPRAFPNSKSTARLLPSFPMSNTVRSRPRGRGTAA